MLLAIVGHDHTWRHDFEYHDATVLGNGMNINKETASFFLKCIGIWMWYLNITSKYKY